MLEKQFEFHLEEFRQLKAEIGSLLARIGYLFRNSIIASTILYSWLLANVGAFSGSSACITFPKNLAAYAIWVPPAFVTASFAFGVLTYIHIVKIGKYLRKCERKFGAKKMGWERSWSNSRPTLTLGLTLIWTCLLVGCFFVSYEIKGILKPLENCPSPGDLLENHAPRTTGAPKDQVGVLLDHSGLTQVK